MKAKALSLITSALLLSLGATVSGSALASSGHSAPGGYSGIEFYGSSQISRMEIQKYLSLKPGAPAQSVAKAAARLRSYLESRHIKANVDIANEANGTAITVDVTDNTQASVPIRKLTFPRHITLPSEVPFEIFEQMMARRELLAQQGRPVTESFPEGVKRFSDEPCNQYADKLMRRVPDMIPELLSVIESDPDASRRSKAIEVLNWAGEYPTLCYKLLPAINDASEQVRASAARFIFPRIKTLPEDFPFEDLIETLSRQLARPSHIDRVLALRCLMEAGRQHQITLYAIKEFDMDRLKQLDENSVVDSVKQPAHQLVEILASLPDRPSPKPAAPLTEF